MMDIDWVMLISLVITHILAYLLGRGDGQAQQEGPSDKAWVEVQKHEIDRRYALMNLMDERNRKHE